jgi:hypothetical protein
MFIYWASGKAGFSEPLKTAHRSNDNHANCQCDKEPDLPHQRSSLPGGAARTKYDWNKSQITVSHPIVPIVVQLKSVKISATWAANHGQSSVMLN